MNKEMLKHSKGGVLFLCTGEQEAKRETELEKGDRRGRAQCIQSNQLAVYQSKTNAKVGKSQIYINR